MTRPRRRHNLSGIDTAGSTTGLHDAARLSLHEADAVRKLAGLIARELLEYKIPSFDILRAEIRSNVDIEMAGKGISVVRNADGTVHQLRVVDPSVDHYLK